MADRKNSEGYSDPTVYGAELNIERGLRAEKFSAKMKEAEIERRAKHLIGALKYMCDCGGFEFVGRIQLKHKGTGMEFR